MKFAIHSEFWQLSFKIFITTYICLNFVRENAG